MKKTISLLLMSLLGMVGTYAWAGSDREETVDRMQNSVEVLQSIMSTPDKGIPEEVLSGARECRVAIPCQRACQRRRPPPKWNPLD
jgi:hypothetical protein